MCSCGLWIEAISVDERPPGLDRTISEVYIRSFMLFVYLSGNKFLFLYSVSSLYSFSLVPHVTIMVTFFSSSRWVIISFALPKPMLPSMIRIIFVSFFIFSLSFIFFALVINLVDIGMSIGFNIFF